MWQMSVSTPPRHGIDVEDIAGPAQLQSNAQPSESKSFAEPFNLNGGTADLRLFPRQRSIAAFKEVQLARISHQRLHS
jgi:hypothetical protein